MWGFLARTRDWDIMSIPPTITAETGKKDKQVKTVTWHLSSFKYVSTPSNVHVPVLTPMLEPRASNCSAIWKASSLVGVSMSVCSLWAEARSDCRMGRANAPVFPEPVSAKPITSFPEIGEKKVHHEFTNRHETFHLGGQVFTNRFIHGTNKNIHPPPSNWTHLVRLQVLPLPGSL